jgi:hypothetical protein
MKLPKYFPPGYFDQWFWITTGATLAVLAGQLLGLYLVRENKWPFILTGIAVGMTVCYSIPSIASRVWRDSCKWRYVDRPALVKNIGYMELLMHENAEFAARHFGDTR